MRDWTRKLLIVSILLALTGGQWMLLQSAAWAGMIVSNLRHDSLPTALSQTFDGKHPCPLCKAIESGKKSQQKSEVTIKIARIEFPLDCRPGFVSGDHSRLGLPPSDEFAASITNPPPFHPPRFDLA